MTIWIEQAAVTAILDEARRTLPDETGGILLGYATATGIVVTEATGPGPRAIHRRDSFVPDDAFHMAAIAAAFERSDGVAWYLGDWHTHPSGGLGLSPRDLRVLKRIATYKPSVLSNPLMLIVSIDEHCEMAVWRYVRKRFRSSAVASDLILE